MVHRQHHGASSVVNCNVLSNNPNVDCKLVKLYSSAPGVRLVPMSSSGSEVCSVLCICAEWVPSALIADVRSIDSHNIQFSIHEQILR